MPKWINEHRYLMTMTWMKKCQRINVGGHLSFNLASNLVLPLPNVSQPFIIECDVLSRNIQVVLMQNQQPIAFERKKLMHKEKLLSINKEMLAFMHAPENFKQYLLGQHFIT